MTAQRKGLDMRNNPNLRGFNAAHPCDAVISYRKLVLSDVESELSSFVSTGFASAMVLMSGSGILGAAGNASRGTGGVNLVLRLRLPVICAGVVISAA